MNKEEAIKLAKDFLRDAKLLVSIEPTEKDVQAIEFLINEVERTALEVSVQEQSKLKAHIYVEDEEAFKKKINNIKNLSNELKNEMKELSMCFKAKIK